MNEEFEIVSEDGLIALTWDSTGIELTIYHDSREEAERHAKLLTAHHGREFVVRPVAGPRQPTKDKTP